MSFDGSKKNILPNIARAAGSVRSGVKSQRGARGAIIIIDVSADGGGDITSLNIYLRSPQGRTTDHEIKIYSWAGLTISAVGVFAFLLSPEGGDAEDWTAAPIKGYLPPEFDVEVVVATNPLTFSVDMFYLP
jgi:hypothetical protein